jgi:hypothetical protein
VASHSKTTSKSDYLHSKSVMCAFKYLRLAREGPQDRGCWAPQKPPRPRKAENMEIDAMLEEP